MSGAVEDELNSILTLTKRQREILQLVADGETMREIALELGIAHQTTKNHMVVVLRKLGAMSSAQAVAVAIREGWIK